MSGTPLLTGPLQRAALQELRERAARHPVEMTGLMQRLKEHLRRSPRSIIGRRSASFGQSTVAPRSSTIGFPQSNHRRRKK